MPHLCYPSLSADHAVYVPCILYSRKSFLRKMAVHDSVAIMTLLRNMQIYTYHLRSTLVNYSYYYALPYVFLSSPDFNGSSVITVLC